MPVREAISYEFDDFRLDVKRQELQKNGEPVALTHKAFQVLIILVQNFGQTVEKENIYDQLWGDSFVEDANLTQHIYVLRKTLGLTPHGESYIETVARTGYRFIADVKTVFSPVIADAFFRPRTSAEPAIKLDPSPTTGPHLKLAEVRPVANLHLEADEEPVSVKDRTEALPKANNRNVKILLIALILLALVVLIIAYFFRTQVSNEVTKPVRSLAVLPFRTIGDESKNDQLGLGMADSIITHLTKLQQIPVRPTSSVIRYMDAPLPNSIAAGREMGVETVLEGTVQRDNDRIRVTVQLTDVEDGKSIWAENFDEPFNDIFAVQDSISQKVVRAFAINLTKQQEKLMSSGSTTNLEALKVYQMGVYLHSTRSKDNLTKAEEYFKMAI